MPTEPFPDPAPLTLVPRVLRNILKGLVLGAVLGLGYSFLSRALGST